MFITNHDTLHVARFLLKSGVFSQNQLRNATRKGILRGDSEHSVGWYFFSNTFPETNILLMAEILHQLRLVVFPIIYRVSAPSQVVVWDFSHQQQFAPWKWVFPLKNPEMNRTLVPNSPPSLGRYVRRSILGMFMEKSTWWVDMYHGQGCRVLLGMGDLPPFNRESLFHGAL